MAKTKQVLFTPSPETVIKPRTYTPEQQEQIETLREYADTLVLPDSDPYYKWERRWMDKWDTIPRYMRAAKWKMEDAKKRLKKTLQWRREYKPELIPPEEVRIESETGKILLNGYDRDGRPIIYMRPGLENTPTSPRQLRHLVWWLERAKDMQLEGQDTVAILIDYKTATLKSTPSLSIARQVLVILQEHYVETLGRGLVVNLPFILNFFYKGIAPFLDPVTKDKIRFNPDLFELIPPEQLDADLGGKYEWEYEHKSYWEQIVNHFRIAPDGSRLQGSTSNEEAKDIENDESHAKASQESSPSTGHMSSNGVGLEQTSSDNKLDELSKRLERTDISSTVTVEQTFVDATS